jgi:uncharacterized membrane protein
MIVPAVILILVGLVLVVLAVASWQGRLPRNIVAGVRTPSTMRSDQAFKVANKVAAPLTAAGGAVLVLGGVLAALLPNSAAAHVLLISALACAVLCCGGAIKGVRAIRTL